jgi:hypothetical protein
MSEHVRTYDREFNDYMYIKDFRGWGRNWLRYIYRYYPGKWLVDWREEDNKVAVTWLTGELSNNPRLVSVRDNLVQTSTYKDIYCRNDEHTDG